MKELSARAGLAEVRSYGKRRSKKSLYSLPRVGTTIFSSLLAVAGCFSQASVIAQTVSSNAQASPAALRDGRHDFDFNIGVWHTRIRRLVHPLTGSNEWVELEGTVRIRKVWNGRAQLEELDAHGASGQLQGLTLFLYNPDAHQWGQYFANREDGVLNRPLIGEFKHGRGELFDQESFHGRTVLTRFVWRNLGASFHRDCDTRDRSIDIGQ